MKNNHDDDNGYENVELGAVTPAMVPSESPITVPILVTEKSYHLERGGCSISLLPGIVPRILEDLTEKPRERPTRKHYVRKNQELVLFCLLVSLTVITVGHYVSLLKYAEAMSVWL